MKFDIEALKQIPLEDVLELLGARKAASSSYSKTVPMHCFCGAHKNGDRHPSLIVWKDKNICKCMVNPEIKGDAINIVKTVLFNGDFKQACIWLHENFEIPYLEDDEEYNKKTIKESHKNFIQKKGLKRKAKKLECIKIKDFKKINLSDFLPKYKDLKTAQKLKLLYAFIYQFALKTNQNIKTEYYYSRGIRECAFIDKIGCLSKDDLKELSKILLETFPYEDLVEFKIINPTDHYNRPLEFRYITKEAFCVVPSFELNNNLLNGLILRATKTYDWQNAKEFQISYPEALIPIPFPFSRKDLEKEKVIITEGHIDAMSIAQYLDGTYAFLSVPGIYNAKEEYLCLLRNKKIYIAFDQDKAGIEGAKRLVEILDKYTDNIVLLEWSSEFGKDLNELLNNGYMKFLIEKFEL
ncbi:toprim domain-containing protein [Caminibacter sp.]